MTWTELSDDGSHNGKTPGFQRNGVLTFCLKSEASSDLYMKTYMSDVESLHGESPARQALKQCCGAVLEKIADDEVKTHRLR